MLLISLNSHIVAIVIVIGVAVAIVVVGGVVAIVVIIIPECVAYGPPPCALAANASRIYNP